jgi:inorganic triphosphatase YgiF
MEIELKIGLASEGDRAKLLKRFGPPEKTVSQRNLFLDGERGELRAEKIALRVRREREFPAAGPPVDRVVLALKGLSVGDGVLFEREEIESPLGLGMEEVLRSPSRLLLMAPRPILALKERMPTLETLKPIGVFDNDRSVLKVPLQVEGREIETVWEVDRSVFPGGRVDCELEIELSDATDASAIADSVRRMLEAAGVATVPQPRGKFERFLDCLK